MAEGAAGRYLGVAIVLGIGFVVLGLVSREYLAACFGAALAAGSLWVVVRRLKGYADDDRDRPVAFVAPAVIGLSNAITGAIDHHYLLSATGVVLVAGAVLRAGEVRAERRAATAGASMLSAKERG